MFFFSWFRFNGDRYSHMKSWPIFYYQNIYYAKLYFQIFRLYFLQLFNLTDSPRWLRPAFTQAAAVQTTMNNQGPVSIFKHDIL